MTPGKSRRGHRAEFPSIGGARLHDRQGMAVSKPQPICFQQKNCLFKTLQPHIVFHFGKTLSINRGIALKYKRVRSALPLSGHFANPIGL